ncbi:MAG: hypothetical protein ACHREM_13340 [Polyangiales bacterium]
MRIRLTIAILMCGAVGILACKEEPKPMATTTAPSTPAPTPTPSATVAPTPVASAAPSASGAASAAVAAAPIPAEATKKFAELCSLCHGKEGKGDGIGGKGMNPPPRIFTDATWQASVTDDHIKTVILKGGPAVGKAATMPPNADLEGKPEVVEGLMRIVRSFKAP